MEKIDGQRLTSIARPECTGAEQQKEDECSERQQFRKEDRSDMKS